MEAQMRTANAPDAAAIDAAPAGAAADGKASAASIANGEGARRSGLAHAADQGGERVLLLAPTGRDAPLLLEQLRRRGLTADICPDIPSLCDSLRGGAGVLFI